MTLTGHITAASARYRKPHLLAIRIRRDDNVDVHASLDTSTVAFAWPRRLSDLASGSTADAKRYKFTLDDDGNVTTMEWADPDHKAG